MVAELGVTVIGRDPDWALVEEFRALEARWQDEALLVIAKRRPGLLEEVFGDVELARSALHEGTLR